MLFPMSRDCFSSTFNILGLDSKSELDCSVNTCSSKGYRVSLMSLHLVDEDTNGSRRAEENWLI